MYPNLLTVYTAGDFDHDADVVNQLYQWNKSNTSGLHFNNAHEIQQSSDDSLCCSIKESLNYRLKLSDVFVLIVGSETDTVTQGSCQYCESYDYRGYCHRDHSPNYESYIHFECRKAKEYGLKIVVIYKSTKVEKSKCPEEIRYLGWHIPAYLYVFNQEIAWNFDAIRNCIMN
jgi:hypothetical protein